MSWCSIEGPGAGEERLAGIFPGRLGTRIRYRENSARSHRKHDQEATGVFGYARGCAKLLACSDLRSRVR
jgi:hypothetical protein